MSFALSAGVTGLQAHQKMLDVAGNNLANTNTTAFKSQRITFSELLSETIKRASQPTNTVGGTNPQQMGSGVGVAGISPNMAQGNIVNTGNPLDLAIEGEGYFVLSDGSQLVYTRAGALTVDANSRLVNPATGYLVQRFGTEGEADGFQASGDSSIHVPYDATLPASATSSIRVQGNLSPDAMLTTTQAQVVQSSLAYTVSGASPSLTTELDAVDQFTSGGTLSGTITITGHAKDGTDISGTLAVDGSTTFQDVIDALDTAFSGEATASLSEGRIVLTGDSSGYSKLDVNLSCDDTELEMPSYFEMSTVGGEEVQEVNVTIYDSQGGSHVLAAALVRTDTTNLWDMVITSVSGNVYELTSGNRRIEGIEFSPTDGSYKGLNSTVSDTAQFVVTFPHDTANPQTISVDLGTVNKFNGLTQFATGSTGTSTAVIREQNGYESGTLSSVSVNNEGILIGAFSNGVKKNLATIQVALFQNASGLESIGNGFFVPSANSGIAVATKGLSSGAGYIHGGALEKSNTDVASEFVSMIQAQNGFQANARTIRVANDILRELTNLIR